jgi:hypothetical protein
MHRKPSDIRETGRRRGWLSLIRNAARLRSLPYFSHTEDPGTIKKLNEDYTFQGYDAVAEIHRRELVTCLTCSSTLKRKAIYEYCGV